MDNRYSRQNSRRPREGDGNHQPRSLSPERPSIDRTYANKQQELRNKFIRLTEQHHRPYENYRITAYALGLLVGREHTYLADEITAENNREQIEARNNQTQTRNQYNNLARNFRQSYLLYANEILSVNPSIKLVESVQLFWWLVSHKCREKPNVLRH